MIIKQQQKTAGPHLGCLLCIWCEVPCGFGGTMGGQMVQTGRRTNPVIHPMLSCMPAVLVAPEAPAPFQPCNPLSLRNTAEAEP